MVEAECYLWGDEFYPSKLMNIDNLIFKNANDPQDFGKSGLYKGKPKPYGSCSLLTPEKITVENRISWMADFICKNKSNFLNAGASEIILQIFWCGIQGNMEFKVSEIARIAKANVPLNVTYIQQEGE